MDTKNHFFFTTEVEPPSLYINQAILKYIIIAETKIKEKGIGQGTIIQLFAMQKSSGMKAHAMMQAEKTIRLEAIQTADELLT